MRFFLLLKICLFVNFAWNSDYLGPTNLNKYLEGRFAICSFDSKFLNLRYSSNSMECLGCLTNGNIVLTKFEFLSNKCLIEIT